MTPVIWIADRLALAQTKSFELPEDGDWNNVNWDEMDWDAVDSDGTMTGTIVSGSTTLDQQGFINGARKILPKMVFLLLPLFALLLALVYTRRRTKFIEHLVLSLHLHAFMFLSSAYNVILVALVVLVAVSTAQVMV